MTAPGPLLPPRLFDRDGVTYRITLPNWGQWLAILDRSARGASSTGTADVTRLLRLWLAGSVEVLEGEAAKPLGPIDALPAMLADALVAEGSAALESLAQKLDIRTERDPAGDGVKITSTLGAYDLKPLSFGTRNACLSRNIGLQNGTPEIDASAYEIALVAASITAPEGVRTRDLMALPLPLGEALVTAARTLSDAAPEAEIAAFAQAGLPHPDLELANLCLSFGLSPQEAMDLPAATARRLNAAANLIRASQPAPRTDTPAALYAAPEDDRVTRIVVQDD